MMKRSHRLIYLLLGPLVLGGCSSMDALITPELRYGQLYALQEALDEAATECSAGPIQRAGDWALTASASLQQQRYYLEREELVHKSDELLAQLYALRWQSGDGKCQSYRLAGQTTGELLALLNAPDTVSLNQRKARSGV